MKEYSTPMSLRQSARMLVFSVGLILSIQCARPEPASAQMDQSTWAVSIGQDAGLATGDYGDLLDWSWGLTGGVHFSPVDALSVSARGGFSLWAVDDVFSDAIGDLAALVAPGVALKPTYRHWMGTIEMRVSPFAVGDTLPQLLVFGGVHRSDLKLEVRDVTTGESGEDTSTETDPLWGLGLGWQFYGAEHWGAELGARWHRIEAESALHFLQFHAALSYRFE